MDKNKIETISNLFEDKEIRSVWDSEKEEYFFLKIKKIDYDFSVCKVKDFSEVNFKDEYCFIGKTDEENSLVCISDNVPNNVIEREDNWKAFRIQGVLDFSLIGILSKILEILAKNNIGIFVVSTYNTDYILTKKENYNKALECLSNAGYEII